MSSIIQIPFRVAATKAFIDSFTSNSYYIGLGKVDEWQPDDANPTGSDSNPNIPLDIEANTIDSRRNLFAIKRINSSDLSLAIVRNDWTSGEIYDEYDDTDELLYTKKFHIVTSELKIYKCISNNNGAVSTIEPTFTTNNIVELSDNYCWKYMGLVSSGDQIKFLMNDFAPVTDNSNATTGQITGYHVVNGGSGYSSPTLTVTGNGTSATANLVTSSGIITDVIVTGYGSGYTYADCTITGSGSGAVITPILSPSVGHGYSISNELAGFNCILSVKIEYDESTDFLTNNDFRQVVIIKNPLTYGSSAIHTAITANLTHIIEVDTVVGFSNDDVVEIKRSGNVIGTAIIANIIDSGKLAICQVRSPIILVGDTLHTTSGDAVISIITYPEANAYSGFVIYTNNRTPITRDILQTETIRIPFEF